MTAKTTTYSFQALKTLRKFWLQVHLYIGLLAGAVFVLSGLAGSLSVFWPEIDTALNSSLKQVTYKSSAAEYRSLSQIVAAAKAVIPDQGKAYAFVFPAKPDEAFLITYSLPAKKMPEKSEWHQVFVNPYTASVTGQRLTFDTSDPWRGSLMNFFVRFHYSLALGEAGKTLVGIVSLFLLFSVLTGLILWWPSPGKLRQALTIKRSASIERFNFDLHKTVGFYFSIILLVVLFSGIYLVFTPYVTGLVKLFSPLQSEAAKLSSIFNAEQQPLKLGQVTAITDQNFPDGEYKMIIFPQDGQGFYRIVKRAPAEINRTRPRRMLWLDQYSGKVLRKTDLQFDSAGDVFLQWLYPLHNGEAFGLLGRIIICITGLVPMILYVTGLIRWLQKRRAKSGR